MFSQASVILFMGGMSGRHSPWADKAPLADTPLERHTPGQTFPGQTAPSPKQMSTAADCTQPTGMHFC